MNMTRHRRTQCPSSSLRSYRLLHSAAMAIHHVRRGLQNQCRPARNLLQSGKMLVTMMMVPAPPILAAPATIDIPSPPAQSQATEEVPSPLYYWAIPEQSLISTVLSSPDNLSLHFISRNGGGLEDIKRQALAYPQFMQAIMLDSTESAIACARAWLQPLQPLGACGMPAGFFRNVLFWDSSRITTPPRWTTLWDVARYPGQRALFQGPRVTLEVALLADGVPPAQIYKELSTPQGVDRAFQKLNQLSPYIIWWRSPSEAYHILREQTVLMGVTPSAIIFSGQARHTLARPYQAQENNILFSPAVWGIPATLSAEKTNETKAILLTNPPHLPPLPDPFPAESLEISDSFWATHALFLSERFKKWLAHLSPPDP